MSADHHNNKLGFTRARDLGAVAVVAALAGFLLLRLSYASIPPLPRLAGIPAAILGIAEGVLGPILRRRLRSPGRSAAHPHAPAALPALTAARILMAAKASSLGGAAFGGLWIGVLAHVAPRGGQIAAASADTVTALIGLVCAAILVAGALVLEHCCKAPTPGDAA